MFVQKRPDPAVARAELKRNLGVFAVALLVIRAAPYALDALQGAQA